MFLALKEMARAKVRFGLLIAAIGLLVFLILFQQSLQNGLLTSFVGAIRNQSAPVLVYTVDGQRVIQGSVITPDLDALVRGADGVGEVGRIGQGTFTVTAADGELTDTTLLGYDDPELGAPTTIVDGRLPAGPGEAVGSEADADAGFDLGDVVRVEPGGLELTIVGLAGDAQLNAGPTLFVDYGTYLDAVVARNPSASEPLPNVLAVAPADGTSDDDVVASINAQSDQLDALTKSDAADETPGVAQVQQSFRVIFLLYGLVIPCVTGLFFLIVTFQKSQALTLLRAIGAPAGRLVSALLIQAMIIIGAGYAIGVLLYSPLSQQRIGGIPLRFETPAVIFWAILLTLLGLGSSLLSARRVLAIDPIEATTGGANR
jgi:putative ABC transport system permease protein